MRNARFIIVIVTGALAALVITGLSLFVLPTYWGAARIDDALKQPTTTIDTSQNNASTSTTPPTTAPVDKLVGIAKAKSEADNRVRELGLKVAAGIGAITAALVGWGRLELSRNEARLAESGHVTERFTKAIEQLGNGSLDIRLGGIYALERIARDSGRDRPVVFEVLTAFVREHAGAEVDDPTSPEPNLSNRFDNQQTYRHA